ncbi:hypothetical protein AVEN_248796-1 [Araneus ventricosus]|uniref:S1 motif domain-containing protein n=1 Tax=Araneus ventricosus TaxID=182803 RepID=A0A4Y2M9W8_ARAVE|nr:hypothetical protein AVEN_142280-1 [Araneus ventricosus]GBN23927.1 hypothetical protein AVEN_211826-1 [Araneus ventricosus]GBN25713.1 hypothetical protein AVEN_248796-1 [Araneus ventricosus]
MYLVQLLHPNSFYKDILHQKLYNLSESSLKGIEPELTAADLEQGKKVKGFIKSVSDDRIIINIGHMLDGKVSLHKCTSYGCSLCKYSQNILQKYSIGDVLEVAVESVTATKGLYSLSLPELASLGVNQQSRLNITKDIDWNEL